MVPGMVFTIEPMINEGDFECEVLDDDWTAVTAEQHVLVAIICKRADISNVSF